MWLEVVVLKVEVVKEVEVLKVQALWVEVYWTEPRGVCVGGKQVKGVKIGARSKCEQVEGFKMNIFQMCWLKVEVSDTLVKTELKIFGVNVKGVEGQVVTEWFKV